jgi:serine/threonine protein kinase
VTQVSTEGGQRLVLGECIGSGGEGDVWTVVGPLDWLVKLYKPGMDIASLERKVGWLIAHPPVPTGPRTAFAWPIERVYAATDRSQFRGFVMRRASGKPLYLLTNVKDRLAHARHVHWGQLLAIAQNLCNLVHALHVAGHVAGDINESNFHVDIITGSVTMLDCDSVQSTDTSTGEVYHCVVAKPDFCPPEIQNRVGSATLGHEQDSFALAILVFLLILEGTHPFAGVDEHPEQDFASRILRGASPFVPGSSIRPPPLSPSLTILDASLRALVQRAFGAGLRIPHVRPTPAEWSRTLHDARQRLTSCAQNPLHQFSSGQSDCPWCHRRVVLRGVDPYPGHLSAPPPSNSSLSQSSIQGHHAFNLQSTSQPQTAVQASLTSVATPGLFETILLAFVWLLLIPFGAVGSSLRRTIKVRMSGSPGLPSGTPPSQRNSVVPMLRPAPTLRPMPLLRPTFGQNRAAVSHSTMAPSTARSVATPASRTVWTSPAPARRGSVAPQTIPSTVTSNATMPAAASVVASRNSTYFHRPNCQWALRIWPQNFVSYPTSVAARQDGRKPCRTCSP